MADFVAQLETTEVLKEWWVIKTSLRRFSLSQSQAMWASKKIMIATDYNPLNSNQISAIESYWYKYIYTLEVWW